MARANSGVGTDLYTLVDVTSMAGEIAAGELLVDVSAFFNSVDPNEFHISLRAFTGPFDFDFGGQLGPENSAPLISDDDPLTWEMASLTDYLVPLGASYLAVGLHNDLFDPANPSYSDSAEITFHSVPEPASPALLLCGVLVFGIRRIHARLARTRNGRTGAHLFLGARGERVDVPEPNVAAPFGLGLAELVVRLRRLP